MDTSITPLPAVTASPATPSVATVDDSQNSSVLTQIAANAESASIVELSAAAQLLAANNAATLLAETIADAVTYEQNIEQLATINQVTRLQQLQNIATAESITQNLEETARINDSAQSALADAALSEAIAAVSPTIISPVEETNVVPATIPIESTPPLATSGAGITTSAAQSGAVTNITENTIATITETLAANIEQEMLMPITPPLATDPTVVAAMAAYHLGETLFSEAGTKVEKDPEIEEKDLIAAVTGLQATTLDLRSNTRGNTANEIKWTWRRVNAIRKNFRRR